MLIWRQRLGVLEIEGWRDYHAFGYSGRDAGLNNPDLQSDQGIGPIPQGLYTFGDVIEHHPHLGHYVIPLIPDRSNRMFGRSAFFMHGDNPALNHTASHGCIVLPLNVRQFAYGNGPTLTVTS